MKYHEVVTRLLSSNPEFAASGADYYSDLPMDVAGTFALYVIEQVDAPSSSGEVLRKAFAFINELGTSDDSDVQDLLATGILEVLADSASTRERARALLSPEVRNLFEEMIRWWAGGDSQNKLS